MYDKCFQQLLIHDAKGEAKVPKEDAQVLDVRLAVKAYVRNVL